MEVNVTATTEQNVFNVTVAQGGSGSQGPKGDPGESAYQVAVDNGFVGTESEWLASLKGEPGPAGEQGPKGDTGASGQDGASAYQVWLDEGNTGSEQDFLDSLVGPKGDTGADGVTPHIDESSGNWFIGDTDTGVHAEGPQGEQGEQGPAGADGQDVQKFYGTQADYDALPSDKLTNGVEHFIEADPQP